MPPRSRYNADRILDAAEALTRREGIAAVTARSVAAELGCSTAPVFTHFRAMDDLLEQLMDRIIARFVEAAGAVVHADPLLGAGLGWLRFASEEPRLYEAVFLHRHPWHWKWGPVRRRLAERMGESARYGHLSRPVRFALVGRASIVLHGLGLELWSGRLEAGAEECWLRELLCPVVDAAVAGGWEDDIHTAAPARSAHAEEAR